MSNKSIATIATMGIDIGKNSFHVIGLDRRGAIVLRQKWSRGQVDARLANMSPCLIGMEACVGLDHLSRKLQAHGHDARLMPAKYVRPYSKGQKNDFPDATAALSLKVEPITAPVRSDGEIEAALVALGREPGGGLVLMPDGFMYVHRAPIILAAARNNVPAVYGLSECAREGG